MYQYGFPIHSVLYITILYVLRTAAIIYDHKRRPTYECNPLYDETTLLYVLCGASFVQRQSYTLLGKRFLTQQNFSFCYITFNDKLRWKISLSVCSKKYFYVIIISVVRVTSLLYWTGRLVWQYCYYHWHQTVRVCNSHMVSILAIWTVWHRHSVVNMLSRFWTQSHFMSKCMGNPIAKSCLFTAKHIRCWLPTSVTLSKWPVWKLRTWELHTPTVINTCWHMSK